MIELTKAADVYMITMNDGPNMIDPAWQVRMIEVLEAVEAATMQLLRAKLPPLRRAMRCLPVSVIRLPKPLLQVSPMARHLRAIC